MSARIAIFSVLIVGVLVGCQTGVGPQTGETSQSSILDLGNMVAKLGLPVTDYTQYGCFCGLGNAGANTVPVDATDSCCQVHDTCYDNHPANCDCKFKAYNWYDEAGWIGCLPNNDACAAYCCACDADVANCIAGTRDTYNPNCRGFEWSSCSADGAPECCGNSDCPDQEYCIGGQCMMLCGGGKAPGAFGGAAYGGTGYGGGSNCATPEQVQAQNAAERAVAE